ncbi:hypothetical protein CsSME_00043350 [Camellia sinensis var. sinensis]
MQRERDGSKRMGLSLDSKMFYMTVAKLGTGPDLPYRMAVHPGGDCTSLFLPLSVTRNLNGTMGLIFFLWDSKRCMGHMVDQQCKRYTY